MYNTISYSYFKAHKINSANQNVKYFLLLLLKFVSLWLYWNF